MNAPPLLQPPPPAGTLDRFASATVDLLGAEATATLQDHLQALAVLARADLALLYHGSAGAPGFDLVASFGVPRESAPALRSAATAEPAAVTEALALGLAGLGVRARWDEALWADGDCVGRLVFGSRRWDAFHPTTLAVFAATGAQIAAILQHRLSEGGDAAAASSPDIPPSAGAGPLLFRRRRDRFIALLAHELRNPVAPIQSGLDLLATDRLDAAARHDTVRMMQRQVAQLAHLIDDFLDTARLNTGRLRAQRRPVRLLVPLATALESVEPAAQARRQRLERLGWDAAEPLIVDADPVRLTQAFADLLAAGVAATPVAGTITVRLAVGAEAATIAFEDGGPPIAEDGGGRLFDVFAMAAQEAEADAGLDLVRGLLSLNDGTVVARNRSDGGGRVFTVTLPIAARYAQASAGLPLPPAPIGRRILVVDDNLDAAESLGALFRLDGHDVRLAHDGPAAVAAAGAFAPEVIVMDLGLPGFSGHEAIVQIRSAPGAVRPAILALTGWGTRADRDASARAGADLHLVKPVAQAQLNSAIEGLLRPGRPVVAPQ